MLNTNLAIKINHFVKDYDPYEYADEYDNNAERGLADVIGLDPDFLIGFFEDWMEETSDAEELSLLSDILSDLRHEKLVA